MQLLKRYPLEIFLLLLFLYSFFISGWAGKTQSQQLISFLIIVLFFVLIGLARIANLNYTNSLRTLKQYLQSAEFNSKPLFSRYLIAALIALVLVVFTGLIEVFIITIVTGYEKILAVGFPFPTYSFVSKRILPVGIFLDTITFSALIIIFSKIKK